MSRISQPHEAADRYRPVSARRRLLIALMAVATAITVVLLMLDPALRLGRAKAGRDPGPAPCTQGNQTDCVGGTSAVILLPASPTTAASAAR